MKGRILSFATLGVYTIATARPPSGRMDQDEFIDWDRVSELRAEVGAEDFDEILELFLAEVDASLARVADAPTADEFHALRGSALNLGMAALAQRCGEAEDGLKQSGYVPELAEIGEIFRQSRACLENGR